MLHFLYASDEGFVTVLKASMLSLLRAHDGTPITVHIAAQDFTPESRAAITALVESFGQTVNIVDMPDFAAQLGDVDTKRFTLSAFSRLFVDSLVPADVSRIIYLDCDTLVMRDLTPLWSTDLHGNVIGAVNDCRGWRYSVHLGLKKDAVYINSGVLLIDVDAFRSQRWQARFRDAIVAYDGLLEFPDNDLICMLMQDTIEILPPEYNMIGPVRVYDYADIKRLRRPSGWYSREAIAAAKENPAILHYTTFFAKPGRPWHEGYNEQDGALFRESIAATGGKLKPAVRVGGVKKLAVSALSTPFKPLVLSAIGVVHGVVKPTLDRSTSKKIVAIGRDA